MTLVEALYDSMLELKLLVVNCSAAIIPKVPIARIFRNKPS